MKLRNKRTGEIIEFNKGKIVLDCNDSKTIYFNSLEDLEEWEDVPEEPKDYWYIDCMGDVIKAIYKTDDFTRTSVAIGNHFDTPEEAELAVRKLKAWNRLKDKGFRFDGLCESVHGLPAIEYGIDVDVPRDSQEDKDLDLLFGGEE